MTGTNPRLDIAIELEKIALEDEYFVKRKLYPNVDFYSGIIFQAMGFPVGYVPRALRHPAYRGLARAVAGDARGSEQKIARPRQIYTGYEKREVVPRAQRSPEARRRLAWARPPTF